MYLGYFLPNMKHLLISLLICLLTSCNGGSTKGEAEKIIAKAITKAGGEKYENAEVQFTFRKNTYTSSRKNGRFELTRTIIDSIGEATDVLNNEGLKRFRKGVEEQLHDTIKSKFANSVNSVHYFVQLPYGLDAPAVKENLVGRDTVAGEPYYEIEVTFKKEGGGTDYEDEYMYWIHQENFTVDYLAYRFYVNEGGIRFRKAYDPRNVNGIRFVDYKNYKLGKNDWETFNLANLDELFAAGKLVPVSIIETEVEKVVIND